MTDAVKATTQRDEKALRADGRRNRERILAAAEELIAQEGANVSLEAIARRAGVGSATLHRHFASRGALLEAVFRDGVTQLCAHAAEQAGREPGAELVAWLEELTVYAATHRGLAAALLAAPDGIVPEQVCCTALVRDALDGLVARATAAGELKPGVCTGDLLLLSNAIGAATEAEPDTAVRLLRLATSGLVVRCR